MKRFALLALMAVLVPGLALYVVSCGGGGGGGGGGLGPVTYSSPSQAASSSQTVMGAVVLSGTVGSAADSASGSIPAGYAPSFSVKAAKTSSIAYIDPRLKTVVDKMVADLKSPMIGGTLANASSLKTASLAPFLASSITVSTSCAGGGYYTISGTDTSVISYKEDTITVTYTNCRSSALSTYDILSGSLQAYHKHMLDGSADSANVTATGLSIASYVTGTWSSTDTLTGTFNKTLAVTSNTTGTVTSGQNNANGAFTVTDSSGIGTFSFTNVSDVWSTTTTTTSTTDEQLSNRAFSLALSGGGKMFTFTLSLTNLDDKTRTNADLSEDWWINGSIGMSWAPNLGGPCLPGTITITTLSPIHTPSPVSSSCPTSGEITVNNADIKFGVPSGSQITLTVGGTSQVIADCNSLGGGQCI